MSKPIKAPSGAGYEVGYGRPPCQRQFKPGHSGNPKGRPRRDTSLPAILGRSLNELVTIRLNGRPKRIPLSEALIRKMLADATHGDHRAQAQILKLELFRTELAAEAEKQVEDVRRSADLPEDEALLDHLKRQLLEESLGERSPIGAPAAMTPSAAKLAKPLAPVRRRPRPEKLP